MTRDKAIRFRDDHMRERPDCHKTVLALMVVGALFVTLVGGYVGIVKRVKVPTETSHVLDMNNELLLDGYTRVFRNTPDPTTPETEHRVHGYGEKEFSLHRVGNE